MKTRAYDDDIATFLQLGSGSISQLSDTPSRKRKRPVGFTAWPEQPKRKRKTRPKR